MAELREGYCQLGGRMAVGIVLGVLALLGSAFAGLFFFVTERTRQADAQNNLKAIVLAFHDFVASNGRSEIPPAAVYDQNGQPLYSWRVLLLPYLGEEDLSREFDLGEPWDSPHNIQLLGRIPKVYQAPGITPPQPGLTFYQVFTGPETPFPTDKTKLQPYAVQPGLHLWAPPRSRLPNTFVNGTSNTVAVVEAPDPVPWTKPVDLLYDAKAPFPRVGGVFHNHVNAAFFDGSARQLPQKTAEQVLRDAVNPYRYWEGTDW